MNNTTLTKSEMIQYLMDNQSMTRQEGRLFVESFLRYCQTIWQKVIKSSCQVLAILISNKKATPRA